MEARIIRGTPRSTPKGRPIWQLETRTRTPLHWDSLLGTGYTSTRPVELRQFARSKGWKLTEDHSQDREELCTS